MSWNPYPYAFGNPVNYTDPSGEFPWLAAMADVAVNAAMGAATGAAFDAGMQRITNALNGRDPLKCMDWDSVRWSAVEGALGSLFGDGPWSILGNFAVTMAVGVWGRGLSHEEALSDAMYGAIFDLALEGFGDKIGDFFSGGGGKPDFSGPRYIDDVGGNSRSADRIVDMNGRRGNDIVTDFELSDARLADDINGNIRLDIDFDNLQYAFEKPKFLNGIQQYGNDFNPNTVMRDGGDSLSYDAPNRIKPGECSFAPETLVSTTEGDKPIAEIEVGDIVLAYNEETGEVGEYPVTAVWSHDDDNLLTLSIDGEVIVTTTDHPFYTESGEWVVAGDLQIGDEIISADGTHGVVDAVALTVGTAEVYNLTVDEAHTYFVGDGAWLVHNACRIPKENPHHIGGNKALERYDALKNGILTPSEMQKHMVAAEAEAMGQPTIFKSGGDPYDHAHELRGHYNALVNIIKALKRVTYRPTGLSPELEQELKGIITEVEGHRQALETFLKKIKRFRK